MLHLPFTFPIRSRKGVTTTRGLEDVALNGIVSEADDNTYFNFHLNSLYLVFLLSLTIIIFTSLVLGKLGRQRNKRCILPHTWALPREDVQGRRVKFIFIIHYSRPLYLHQRGGCVKCKPCPDVLVMGNVSVPSRNRTPVSIAFSLTELSRLPFGKENGDHI